VERESRERVRKKGQRRSARERAGRTTSMLMGRETWRQSGGNGGCEHGKVFILVSWVGA